MTRRTDFIVVLAIVLAAVPASMLIGANFLTSTLLFIGVPSLYLLFRQKGQWKRMFSAAFLFGLLYGFLLDYLAEVNNAWVYRGILPYKILGVVSIDVMVWFFLWIFFLVLFYEHFLEHERSDRLSPNIIYALYPGLALFAGVIIIHIINPQSLLFGYTYLVLGLLTLPPFIYVIRKKPVLLMKFLKASLFFVLLYLCYEVIALNLGQWHFPGQYIGMVQIGNVKFPLEEFLFWILMSSPIVLSYYELYIDDLR